MLPDLLYVVLALGVFALFALALEGCERLCVQANMIIDYVIGGAVAELLLGYLGYALSGRRSSEGAPRWPPTSFRSSSILLSSSPARHSLVATWRYSCLPADDHLRAGAGHHPVDERTEGRAFGLIGAPRVNVLLINIGLDRMAKDRVSRVVDEDG